MDGYLEIPMSKLCGVKYTNSDRTPDELEMSFINEISHQTGFSLSKIHINEARKSKYSRTIDWFDFEYEGKNYILEKGKIKEGNN